ncbi:type II toxin-antitoxin system Phd/YefM family antitoxin [Microcoleus sp. A003_D6]|uniref:type II toxin-antitoxin system Phd/YefM family antitoxin n=1 Tax=Microcoleus sp. A003_D6 TaxID=3055266 RepID=UPI002FD772F8
MNNSDSNGFDMIPYEEFEALLALIADIEDLMDLRAAKEEDANQPSVPLAEVKRMLGLSREFDKPS